jgi:hypothetical protein
MSTLSSSANMVGALMAHSCLAASVVVAVLPFVAMVLAVYLIASGLDDNGRPYE